MTPQIGEHGKREFANVKELRNTRKTTVLDEACQPNLIAWVLKTENLSYLGSERDSKTEGRSGKWEIAGFEGGGRDHETNKQTKMWAESRSWEKYLPKEYSSVDTLVLVQ